jgi:phospholipase/carboxylesterase
MIDPHASQPVASVGPAPAESGGVIIMIHGRNAAPANVLDLVPRLARPKWSYLAPTAANRTWYPLSFLSPVAQNEPYLSSAISAVDRLVRETMADGVPSRRIVLLGFSQGACLAAEYAVRHPRHYGGVIVFSGGLIGPPGTSWKSTLSLAGTRAFFGCSDVDAHVPKTRVDESADVFTRMGALVNKQIYPGMGHLVSQDEIVAAQALLDAVWKP